MFFNIFTTSFLLSYILTSNFYKKKTHIKNILSTPILTHIYTYNHLKALIVLLFFYLKPNKIRLYVAPPVLSLVKKKLF